MKQQSGLQPMDVNTVLSSISEKVREAFLERKDIVADISRASSNFRKNLFTEIGLVTRVVEGVISDFSFIEDIPEFSWDSSKEDSAVNKRSYLQHLTDILQISQPFTLFDGDNPDVLMETSFNELQLRGKCDALISSTTVIDQALDNCHILFELMKPDNKDSKSKQSQLELLALDSLSTYQPIHILTDLIDLWEISWIMKDQVGISISCTRVSRTRAIGFLRYHLGLARNMLRRLGGLLDVEDDSNLERDDGEDDDNGSTHKRIKYTPKAACSFQATKLKYALKSSRKDDDDYQDMIPLSDDEKVQKFIWSFIDANRSQLLKSAALARENN